MRTKSRVIRGAVAALAMSALAAPVTVIATALPAYARGVRGIETGTTLEGLQRMSDFLAATDSIEQSEYDSAQHEAAQAQIQAEDPDMFGCGGVEKKGEDLC